MHLLIPPLQNEIIAIHEHGWVVRGLLLWWSLFKSCDEDVYLRPQRAAAALSRQHFDGLRA